MMSIKNNYSPLIIIYMLLWILSIVSIYKMAIVDHFVVSISSIFLPVLFFIGNITSEVYGYIYYKKLLSLTYGILLIIAILTLIFISFFKSQFINIIKADFLLELIHHLPKVLIAILLGIICSSVTNSYITPKFRHLLNKKYFTLRESGVSIIGELVFIIIIYYSSLYNIYSLSNIFKTIFSGILIYLIVNLCLIVPSNIVVRILKNSKSKDLTQNISETSIFEIIYRHAVFENKN